jgi:hypothetical protein
MKTIILLERETNSHTELIGSAKIAVSENFKKTLANEMTHEYDEQHRS